MRMRCPRALAPGAIIAIASGLLALLPAQSSASEPSDTTTIDRSGPVEVDELNAEAIQQEPGVDDDGNADPPASGASTAKRGPATNARANDPTDAKQAAPAELAPQSEPASLPTGADKSGVTSQAISIPKGSGTVKGMGESFSAQLSTGIATFSVPFALSAARGAAQPSLGLSYSSSSGFGMAGVGWDVGVPFIARQTDRGTPRYGDQADWQPNQDRFVFNGGQELVPICLVSSTGCSGLPLGEAFPAWASGWQYFRARVEGSFLRFFWSADHRTWRVQDKGGVTMELGVPFDGMAHANPADPQVALDANPDRPGEIFRWHLVRQYDTYGDVDGVVGADPNNPVVYLYAHDAADARVYLTDIFDTSPASAPTDDNFNHYAHRTHLEYAQRNDPTFSFRSGWRMGQSYRLARVTISSKSFEGFGPHHLVRLYDLTYDDSYHVSLLNEVKVSGRCTASGDEVSAPQAPLYGPFGTGVTPTTGCDTLPPNALPPMTFGYTHVGSAPGDLGYEQIGEQVNHLAQSPKYSVDEALTDLFDVNSDGLPDVVVTAAALFGGKHGLFLSGKVGSPTTTNPLAIGFTSTTLGLDVSDVTTPGVDANVLKLSNANVNPLDLSGDGRIDLVHMPRVKAYEIFSPVLQGAQWNWKGRTVTTASGQDPKIDFSNDSTRTRVADVDGDGLVDVVVTTGTEMETFFSLGRYPNGYGQFGHAEGWTTASTATLSNDPIRTCLPWSATPIQFDSPDVKLADMNGDGLVDIVRVRSGEIRYWPGRGNGFWGTGARDDCAAGSFGQERHVAMTSGPNFAVVQGDNRLLLDDVNGDGLDDVIEVRFNAVDVYVNVDGTSWTPRHVLYNTPPAPDSTNRVRLVDVDGSGTRDLLWGDGYDYKYIDLQDGKRPWLLSTVKNGLGKLTSLTYRSSVAEMLSHSGTAEAWTSTMPTVTHVVSSVTEADLVSVSGRGPTTYTTDYSYFDPLYEGRQREFRGFQRAQAKRIGDANSPTDIAESRFLLGECKDECAVPGVDICAQDQMWRDNPREALKGLPTVSEKSDESGAYLSTEVMHYTLRPLYVGRDLREVRYAFESEKHAYAYDTGPFVPGSSQLSASTVALEGACANPNDTVTTFTQRSGSRAVMKSGSTVDAFGNRKTAVAYGCIDGCAASDEVITTFSTPFQPAGDATYWLWRTQRSYVEGSLHAGQRNDTTTSYDAHGNPLSVTAVLSGTLPLDRRSGMPGAPTASADGGVTLTTKIYDADLGFLRVETSQQDTRCRSVAYDAAFEQLPTSETIYVGAALGGSTCSGEALTTSASYARGFASVIEATDMAGAVTVARYDQFGRIFELRRPTAANGKPGLPTVTIEYFLADVTLANYSAVHTSTQDGADPDQDSYLESWSYIDGFGRPIATLAEAEDAGRWILGDFVEYDAKSAVRRKYLPVYIDAAHPASGSVLLLPQTSAPLSPYGRQRYDAFGRAIQTYDIDGTVTLASVYHALSADLSDAADLQAGPHQGTFATTTKDGHGRAIDVVERIHAAGATPGPGAIEERHVETKYLPTGEPEVISRRRGTDSVVRWLRYDSLGRMVLNVEPSTSVGGGTGPSADPAGIKAWRYAYDDSGELVGTSDARQCGSNFHYDRVGRLLAEDYLPCLPEHAPYSAPDLATFDGVEVAYVYDHMPASSPTWMQPPADAAPGFSTGRLIATFDRASAAFMQYDARGRVTRVATRVAKPITRGSTGAPAGEPGSSPDTVASPPFADRYALRTYQREFAFDAADRELYSSTGAQSLGVQGLPVHEPGFTLGGTTTVSTHYTARGTVSHVDGSYNTLIGHVDRTADGLVTQIRYGDLARTTTGFTYDERRRVRTVQTQRGPPATWTTPPSSYQPAPAPTGPPTTFQLVLQDQQFKYDTVNNPIEVRDWRNAGEWPAGAKPVTRKINYDDLYRAASVEYEYSVGDDTWTDPFEHEAAADDDARRARPSPRIAFAKRTLSQTFQYDWLGNTTQTDDDAHGFYDRSLGEVENDGAAGKPYQLKRARNTAAGGERTGDLAARYDEAGNLTRFNVHRDPTHCLGAGCSQRYDYQWDEVGRLVRARRWDVASSTDLSEPNDALPSATSAAAELSYVYDAGDQRVVKTASDPSTSAERHTVYVFGSLELRRAAFVPADGDYELSEHTEVPYLFAHGARLARIAWEDTSKGVPTLDAPLDGKLHVLFELGDHLGSTSVVLDQQTSELVEASTYQAYGGTESDYRPDRWKGFREDYKFTGKEEDVEVGLQYFGKRFLNPLLGRWVSADPLAVHGLAADLNVYAYVHGAVLKNVDPLGLCGDDNAGGCSSTGDSNAGTDTQPGQGDVEPTANDGMAASLDARHGDDAVEASIPTVDINDVPVERPAGAGGAGHRGGGYGGAVPNASEDPYVDLGGPVYSPEERQEEEHAQTDLQLETTHRALRMNTPEGAPDHIGYNQRSKLFVEGTEGVIGKGLTALSIVLPEVTLAAEGEVAMTLLYRAVSEAEYAQLMQTGRFAASENSLGGKWFAENAAHAAKWGEKLHGPGKFRIVETELPTTQADQLMRLERLDGIGPARYGELEQLSGATVRGAP